MSKIDKSTMEGILTYEQNENDDVDTIFAKQLVCLKEAAFCLDKVIDNLKENILQVRDRVLIVETNIFTLTDAFNHILERMRNLEGQSKPPVQSH